MEIQTKNWTKTLEYLAGLEFSPDKLTIKHLKKPNYGLRFSIKIDWNDIRHFHDSSTQLEREAEIEREEQS